MTDDFDYDDLVAQTNKLLGKVAKPKLNLAFGPSNPRPVSPTGAGQTYIYPVNHIAGVLHTGKLGLYYKGSFEVWNPKQVTLANKVLHLHKPTKKDIPVGFDGTIVLHTHHVHSCCARGGCHIYPDCPEPMKERWKENDIYEE